MRLNFRFSFKIYGNQGICTTEPVSFSWVGIEGVETGFLVIYFNPFVIMKLVLGALIATRV